ncbi:alpha-amylase [Parafannyhessea umbonata]|uniref:alpha-amylase n=1 Tax=Parafannyhessea umbonata TaxID=604330 RepID=UPI002A7FC015|nr:alpha-amylase [Parafannyhessea umbonata]MDY4418173.1 alpha-amylase [Parafannyhessea umbonata]
MDNGTMLQGFSWYLPADGAHWRRLAKSAQRLADEGITAVWLPPAYKGQAGGFDVGYGVYDTYDLGEFDQKGTVATKYGTKEEYLACIRALQAAGVQALGDVVLNQRMGADATEDVVAREVAANDRNRVVAGPHKIRAWTRFCFPGRRGRYSAFTWDWRCFHGVDWDDATRRGGIYLFDGKSWDNEVDHDDNGNYDYLMGCDVDLSYPPVYDELVRWGKWYLDTTGLDGFRFDALKHMGREFYQRWLPEMRDYTGRELFSVGEYWTPRVDELVSYINDMPTMSLFDVPLHYHFYSASCSNGDFDLSKLFDRTLSTWNPVRAVTFVENHDTQPGQALQSLVLPWFKPSAYACILLREAGYPCVFYGDLYGMPNDGNIPAVVELPLLMEIRRRFAYGRQRDWLDDADTIGWTREGERGREGSGVAVVLTDRAGGAKRMLVGEGHAGELWHCVIGEEKDVRIGPDGWAEFGCGGGRLSVYLSDAAAGVLEHDWVNAIHTPDADPYTDDDPVRAGTEEAVREHPELEGEVRRLAREGLDGEGVAG